MAIREQPPETGTGSRNSSQSGLGETIEVLTCMASAPIMLPIIAYLGHELQEKPAPTQ
jgi:hypothetical protein